MDLKIWKMYFMNKMMPVFILMLFSCFFLPVCLGQSANDSVLVYKAGMTLTDTDKRHLQITFKYSEAYGLDSQTGVIRRDNSDIIKAGGLYYVWYTRSNISFYGSGDGYDATVWYATSPDGVHWQEQGECIRRGGPGSWDEQSVFTPNILEAKGKYYLFYTGVPRPFNDRTKTAIGMAIANSPGGPWKKFKNNPVLHTGESGVWDEETGTRSKSGGAWDSHRIDDAGIIVRNGKYWLYYKGRQMGLSPAETKMGVAIADRPKGPYIKSVLNPVVKSGHEVLVWPYKGGVVSVIGPVGPEKNTLQFAPDGLNFRVVAPLAAVPSAPGAYRPGAFKRSAIPEETYWGLSMINVGFPYLVRFDIIYH
jgi:hypothetical protein